MSRRSAFLAAAALLAALAPGLAAAGDTPAPAPAKPSYFTRLWELDAASRGTRSVFSPYHATYVLAYTYNSSPNQAVFEDVTPSRTLMKPEAAYQLSFKARLWPGAFGGKVDLWLGYTQRAFWQVYDIAESAPFREVDHEPELIALFRTRFRVLGFDGRFVQISVNHQSNGLSRPLSRNWSRLIASVGLERGPLSLLFTGWVRVLFKPGENENPGLTRYVGYGEARAFYFYKRQRFGVRLRDNLSVRFNRAAFQADWAFPLFARIGGIVQAYFGYGESLLDFDHRVSRIGAGIVLRDWD
ncbi:MAG TPA: phospholipase A [Acidobacteriota bacterium]|nr:phospholipase A [Acidobacteriota bacterium]